MPWSLALKGFCKKGGAGGVPALGDPVDHGQVLTGSGHAFAGGAPGGVALSLLCAGTVLLENTKRVAAISTQKRE